MVFSPRTIQTFCVFEGFQPKSDGLQPNLLRNWFGSPNCCLLQATISRLRLRGRPFFSGRPLDQGTSAQSVEPTHGVSVWYTPPENHGRWTEQNEGPAVGHQEGSRKKEATPLRIKTLIHCFKKATCSLCEENYGRELLIKPSILWWEGGRSVSRWHGTRTVTGQCRAMFMGSMGTLPPTKWKMASWETVFLYKPVVFHFHDCFRESKCNPGPVPLGSFTNGFLGHHWSLSMFGFVTSWRPRLPIRITMDLIPVHGSWMDLHMLDYFGTPI